MSKATKQLRRKEAEEEIIYVEDAGHTVERFTDYHWRIDEKYDVWPTSKKYMRRDGWHDVKKYEKLIDIFI